MGTVWSLAAAAAGAAQSYGQLLTARAALGAGEAGYGPAAGALLATRFPPARRATVLGAFQSAAPLGATHGVARQCGRGAVGVACGVLGPRAPRAGRGPVVPPLPGLSDGAAGRRDRRPLGAVRGARAVSVPVWVSRIRGRGCQLVVCRHDRIRIPRGPRHGAESPGAASGAGRAGDPHRRSARDGPRCGQSRSGPVRPDRGRRRDDHGRNRAGSAVVVDVVHLALRATAISTMAVVQNLVARSAPAAGP